MPQFEPTIPFGEPELMRASGFARYLEEMAREAPEGAPSSRLSSLSPSLTQDLLRFEQGGREPDLLEVLAACVRHARAVTVHLPAADAWQNVLEHKAVQPGPRGDVALTLEPGAVAVFASASVPEALR